MKVTLSITTPSTMHPRVLWPDSVPIPAVGDRVLFRSNEVTWAFSVTQRTISIGHDPVSRGPGTVIGLTADAAPPEGYVVPVDQL